MDLIEGIKNHPSRVNARSVMSFMSALPNIPGKVELYLYYAETMKDIGRYPSHRPDLTMSSIDALEEALRLSQNGMEEYISDQDLNSLARFDYHGSPRTKREVLARIAGVVEEHFTAFAVAQTSNRFDAPFTLQRRDVDEEGF